MSEKIDLEKLVKSEYDKIYSNKKETYHTNIEAHLNKLGLETYEEQLNYLRKLSSQSSNQIISKKSEIGNKIFLYFFCGILMLIGLGILYLTIIKPILVLFGDK